MQSRKGWRGAGAGSDQSGRYTFGSTVYSVMLGTTYQPQDQWPPSIPRPEEYWPIFPSEPYPNPNDAKPEPRRGPPSTRRPDPNAPYPCQAELDAVRRAEQDLAECRNYNLINPAWWLNCIAASGRLSTARAILRDCQEHAGLPVSPTDPGPVPDPVWPWPPIEDKPITRPGVPIDPIQPVEPPPTPVPCPLDGSLPPDGAPANFCNEQRIRNEGACDGCYPDRNSPAWEECRERARLIERLCEAGPPASS